MNAGPRIAVLMTLSILLLLPIAARSQGTLADYERAKSLGEKFRGLVINSPGQASWIDKTSRFWYRKSVKGGNAFVVVDAQTLAQRPAFDHERLAASLSTALNEKYTGVTLPFTTFGFADSESSITLSAAGSTWKCSLSDYACVKTGAAAQEGPGGQGRPPEDIGDHQGESSNDVSDGMTQSPPPQGQQEGRAGFPFGDPARRAEVFRRSPDDKWEALIQNYNVYLRAKGKTEATALSTDGSEGNYYTLFSIAWSPESKRIAVYRVRPGFKREVHYIESSPSDQVQPKHSTREYAKPGDTLDIAQPVLFEIETRKQVIVENALFANPYSLSRPVWRKDGRAFTFEYNQRGHQVYRIIEVDASNGSPRAVISEEPKTFYSYRPLRPALGESGSYYRYDLNDGREVVWMSERDGWRHLYLFDGLTGRVKNRITSGNWVVRAIDKVDEEKRQIWFQASGMYAGKDPYFNHYYRINFDGTNLVALTEGDGLHAVSWSPDMKYYVDIWSRVDTPPVAELRRSEDGKLLLQVEKADHSGLLTAGWRAPETFTAVARDGKTEIWGVIYRPTNFDASLKYPVIELIYAGPQGSFVPKAFSPTPPALVELGFIVVRIDGMGTNNRSKAFHDVAWRNLGDAGFPDRILWHKAVAAKYAFYDVTRVGVYGTSAGGQNAMGGMLFHPDFYKAAYSNSGCHDNRMDKIWWNEQWMGWPVGPHYAASSNVDNAHRLHGKLLLVVPEMDTNVDPASTLQVVNALIKAGKRFDLLVVPGANHGARGGALGDYTDRTLQDFFVRHLLGVEPPDWNRIDKNGGRPSVVSGQ